MREPENLREVLALELDYMGFIFYPPSKRYVRDFPVETDFGKTKKTGVFVNEDLSVLLDKAKAYKLDVIQLHGDENPQYCQAVKKAGYEVFKAVAIDDQFDFDQLFPFIPFTDMFVFDAKGKLPGGNGIRFNWEKLKEYKAKHPFLLSGGIGMEHLDEIRNFTHPQWKGIDVNSGFEISPGLKNTGLLKEFIKELRNKTDEKQRG